MAYKFYRELSQPIQRKDGLRGIPVRIPKGIPFGFTIACLQQVPGESRILIEDKEWTFQKRDAAGKDPSGSRYQYCYIWVTK